MSSTGRRCAARPRRWRQTIIYELHVRGYTAHPSSGVRHPGTFLGLSDKIPVLESAGCDGRAVDAGGGVRRTGPDPPQSSHGQTAHGITGAIRRCPFRSQGRLMRPEPGQQVREFKEMVKSFHKAGIEVILDVVYNHTCEGNENGPTVEFPRPGQRHLLHAGQRRSLLQFLRLRQHAQLQSSGGARSDSRQPDLSRRGMHVDGFRFDLAAILGRGANGKVLDDPPLIQHIAEHPVLAGTKLIAEAWDAAGLSQHGQVPRLGPLGRVERLLPRRCARVPPRRSRRRRCGRQAYLRQSRPLRRLCGHPYHSVNFFTCHDGFTLQRSGQLQPQAQRGQR